MKPNKRDTVSVVWVLVFFLMVVNIQMDSFKPNMKSASGNSLAYRSVDGLGFSEISVEC